MSGSEGVARRPGGRTARTRQAVQSACLRLLATEGIRGFGMEQLAAEAGVHKTTLYRRWPTMADLLGEVAGELIDRDVPVPDTGSLQGDLRAIGRSIAAVVGDPVSGPALTALFTAPAGVSGIDDQIASFWRRRLAALEPVLARAFERGEVDRGLDAALVFECLGAPLYYRLSITRQPIDDTVVDRAVAVTLSSVGAGLLGS